MQPLCFAKKGVLIVLFFVLPAMSFAQSSYEYYKKAYDAFKDKDYNTAIYYAKKAIEADRYYYQAYGLMGDCYYNLKEYNNAAINYTEALKSSSLSSASQAYYYLSRADVREKLGDYDGAISDYGSCISKYASEYMGSAYWSRGVIYANKKKDFKLAKQDYESALYYYSSDKKSLCTLNGNISDCELSLGNNDKALERANKAIDNDPESPTGYKRQGYAYKAMAKYREAKVSFSKALRLIKNESEEMAYMYRNIGVCQYELGEFDDALTSLQQAIQLRPNYKEAYWDLAYVYYEKEDYKQSIDYYSKTMSYYLDDPVSLVSLYRWRGKNYHALEQYDKAIKDYSTALTYADNDNKAVLHSDISFAHFYSGNISLAIQWINKTLAIKETETYILNKVSFLAARKAFKEIIPLLDKQIEKYPTDYYYFYKRAYYYWKMNNKTEATKDFDKFFELSEKENVPFYRNVYLVFKGKKAEAFQNARQKLGEATDQAIELYNLACLFSLAGNTTDAIKTLDQSLKAGYKSKRWLQLDADLQNIQSLPEFTAMLKRNKISVMVKK